MDDTVKLLPNGDILHTHFDAQGRANIRYVGPDHVDYPALLDLLTSPAD